MILVVRVLKYDACQALPGCSVSKTPPRHIRSVGIRGILVALVISMPTATAAFTSFTLSKRLMPSGG